MLINLPLKSLDWMDDCILTIPQSYLSHLDTLSLEWLRTELESINQILYNGIDKKTWILELKKSEIIRRIMKMNKENITAVLN